MAEVKMAHKRHIGKEKVKDGWDGSYTHIHIPTYLSTLCHA